MPMFILPPPGNDETVLRPIVLDVVRQMMKLTGIRADDGSILFPSDIGKTIQPQSQLDPQGENNKFASSERVALEVVERYQEDSALAQAVAQPEHQFLFRDDRVSTWMKPSYTTAEVDVQVRFRSRDKTRAMKWRDEVRNKIQMGAQTHLHDITYSYIIPVEMIEVLKEIHRMREAVSPYGESYSTWFTACASTRLSNLSNQSGTVADLAASEKQMRVVGKFDFTSAPEKGEGTEENPSWSIGFTYSFQYEKPIGVVLRYPLIVHNQLIADKYRPVYPANAPYQDGTKRKSYSSSMHSLSNFEAGRVIALPDGVQVPAFDEFIPSSIVSETARVITCLVTIDPTLPNPKFLLDLTQLGDPNEPNAPGTTELHAALISYLRSEYANITKPGRCAMVLSLYIGEHIQVKNDSINHIDLDVLEVDSDLKVSLVDAPDLRAVYHLRLGLVEDFTSLPIAAQDRLRENWEVLCLMLQALGEKIMPVPVGNSNYVSRSEYAKAMERLNVGRYARGNHQDYSINIIATLFVSAHRRE